MPLDQGENSKNVQDVTMGSECPGCPGCPGCPVGPECLIYLDKKFLDSSGDEGSRDFCKSETNEKLKIW